MKSLLTIRTSAAVYFEESNGGSCLEGSCDKKNKIFRRKTHRTHQNYFIAHKNKIKIFQ